MSLLFRQFLLGIKSLWLHPLRSLLTVLGIFIGVASVIWLVAISEGIGEQARRQIESLGADTIIVRSVKPPSEKLNPQGVTPYGLTRADFDMLVATVPTLRSAIPVREIRRQFTANGVTIDGRLVGCTPEYKEVTRLEIDRGAFLSDGNNFRRDNKCVLAARVAERLFPYQDPIGKRIYVPEHEDFYEVIGVLKPRNPTAAVGGSLSAQDFSSDVYIPIRTLQQRIGDTVVRRMAGNFEGEILELNQITLCVENVEDVKRTSELIEASLAHHQELEDIAVVVPLELLEQARTTQTMFTIFMGMIAAISLVVGGIGIMNIMLATVTERTREIGIRRALGAKRSHIVNQFLIETSVLSLVGGATGILFGLLCGPAVDGSRWLLRKWDPAMIEQLPEVVRTVRPIIVPDSIVIAFFISLIVGIAFGLYPAMRAARMNPIEALRHE
jgi:putative ABC transport system permease protein